MKSENTITVVSAVVGKEIDITEVENSFTSFQLVAGETINFKGVPDGILLVPAQNEDEQQPLKPNLKLDYDSSIIIDGDAYFIAVKEGEAVSLSNKQIDAVFDAFIDGKVLQVEYNAEIKKVVGYVQMACNKMGLESDKERELLAHIRDAMKNHSDSEAIAYSHEYHHTVK